MCLLSAFERTLQEEAFLDAISSYNLHGLPSDRRVHIAIFPVYAWKTCRLSLTEPAARFFRRIIVSESGSQLHVVMWSSETPSEEGFYWYTDDEICDIVRVTRSSKGELIVTGTALFERHPVETLRGEWAGPIAIPAGEAHLRLPFR